MLALLAWKTFAALVVLSVAAGEQLTGNVFVVSAIFLRYNQRVVWVETDLTCQLINTFQLNTLDASTTADHQLRNQFLPENSSI